MQNKRKVVIAIILILIFSIGFFLLLNDKEGDSESVEEEVINPEEFLEGSPVFRIEEELLGLESQLGEDQLDDEMFEKYYQIENRFFIIRDRYFEGIDEGELLREIEDLLIHVEELEKEIKNINNN